MDSIWKVWSVCTYTDHRSDCGGVTCEAATHRSLQIKLTWAQFSRTCSQTSALRLVSIRACCSATTSPEDTRRDREGAGPSSRLGSVRVWQPGCCRTQARLRCGWGGGGGGGWWLSSLSGSNWDESTDGTTAVDGYFALVYSGTRAAAVLDIFAVSKKNQKKNRIQIIYSFAFLPHRWRVSSHDLVSFKKHADYKYPTWNQCEKMCYSLHGGKKNSRCTHQVCPHCGGFQVWRCGPASQRAQVFFFFFFFVLGGSRPDSFSLSKWWSTDPAPNEVPSVVHSLEEGRGGERRGEEGSTSVSCQEWFSHCLSLFIPAHKHLTFFHFQVLRVRGACSLRLSGVAW